MRLVYRTEEETSVSFIEHSLKIFQSISMALRKIDLAVAFYLYIVRIE